MIARNAYRTQYSNLFCCIFSSYYRFDKLSALKSHWTSSCSLHCRLSSNMVLTNRASAKLNASLFNIMRHYEDLIGITELKLAQKSVLEAEHDFTKTQEARREKHDEIQDVQTRLKEIHAELDKTSRGEDRYLTLLTQEHAIIKSERQLTEEFKRLERAERDCFTILSNRLRDSHEREREQAEKTKYFSIIGSVVCGLIGAASGLIINRMRLRDLQRALAESTDSGRLHALAQRLVDAADQQQHRVNAFLDDLNVRHGFISAGSSSAAPSDTSEEVLRNADSGQACLTAGLSPAASSPEQYEAILDLLKKQDDKLSVEMENVKRLVATDHGYSVRDDGATVVYVGPEMKTLLTETERSLERKIKMNTLAQVVLVYAALAIALPMFFAFLKPAS